MKPRLRIDYNAPFCLSFAFLAMLVYVAGIVTQNWTNAHWFSIPGSASFLHWTTSPRLLVPVPRPGSVQHLFANLTVLLLVGPLLEEMYGYGLLLLLAIVTAILTGLVMVLLFSGSLMGASSIVFAFIILSSFANAKSGTIPLTFILISLIFLGGEVIRAMSRQDHIAQFAHIIGGLMGGAAGFYLARRAETPRW